MKKKHWIIFISVIAFFILSLFIFEILKLPMRVFTSLEVNKAAFKTGETGINLTQMLYAESIQFKGAVLVIPAKDFSYKGKQITANGNIIIKSPDTIKISNPGKTFRVKEISPDKSCSLEISGTGNSLDLKFRKHPGIDIPGLMETDRKIVITESYGRITRVIDNDEFPFTGDDTIEITMRPFYPNFNFYLKENESLVKLYMNEIKEPFPIIKNVNISDVRFYEKESTDQKEIEFLESTINQGNIELSTSNLLGEYFMFQEFSVESGELVTFRPDAVYFLKELVCSGKELKVSMYNKNAREIKKGKHQDLLQSIFPTYLEWLIKEPVTKKFSLLATAITGLFFLIIKLKTQLFPKEKEINFRETGEKEKVTVKKTKKKKTKK